MPHFHDLRDIAKEYLSDTQIEELRRAYLVAEEAHKPQKRSSGEPYIIHPVAVACIVAEMRLDVEAIIAALLHDVIEDTDTTKEELAEQFGETVADLVDGLSKLEKIKFRDHKEALAENFRKMILAMVQDIRVILIKLADRTHNMRTIDALRPDKRRRIANETLEVFSPIAHRLGIHNVKSELEELSFKAMHPNRHYVLQKTVKQARGNRKDVIQSIHTEIEERLKEAGIKAEVKGREKHLYSIYQKMRTKKRPFHSIMDIYAFRIIVDDADTCYRVLGNVHSLYKPRPGKLKDYIAVPKTNGYQSIHTSMVGPHGVPVEVQIRTVDMDHMADRGVAAHWAYKDGMKQSSDTTAQVRAQKWMSNLLELQQNADSAQEFVESVKSDLFPNEIYVFSPAGHIVEMPKGATAVDYAYAVHTDVGNTCTGAKVNRQPYPLSKPLISGQTIEIISSKEARPNAAWLNTAVTSRARTKIRQALKDSHEMESISLGKRLLRHAMGGLTLGDIESEQLESALDKMKLQNTKQLLMQIGSGNIMSSVAAMHLQGEDAAAIEGQEHLPIKGASTSLIVYSSCCFPLPGDSIIAHITSGKGLVIHRDNCSNVKDYTKNRDRYLSVSWGEDIEKEFMAELNVEMINQHGALATLTTEIAKAGSNIYGIATHDRDGRIYQIRIKVSVEDRTHLAKLMRRIKRIKQTVKVSRQKA